MRERAVREVDEVAGRTQPRLVIVEPNPDGHRLAYVRLLAESDPTSSAEWWTSARAAGSREAEVHLGDLIDAGRLCTRLWDQPLGRLGILRAAASSRMQVVVPDGDRWLAAVLVAALTTRPSMSRIRVLMMRAPVIRGRGISLRSRVSRLAKVALLGLISLVTRVTSSQLRVFSLVDAFGYGACRAPFGTTPLRDPVRATVVPSVAEARSTFSIAPDRLVIGLVGAIDLRKSPGLVAEACRRAFERWPGVLLVVGAVQPQALAEINAAGLSPEQLVVDNRYVEDHELMAASRACDAVALMYANHASPSGVLAVAAQAGTPVLVPAGSQLDDTASVGGFGVPSAADPARLAEAIGTLHANREALSLAAEAAGRLLGTADFVTGLVTG